MTVKPVTAQGKKERPAFYLPRIRRNRPYQLIAVAVSDLAAHGGRGLADIEYPFQNQSPLQLSFDFQSVAGGRVQKLAHDLTFVKGNGAVRQNLVGLMPLAGK